MSTKSFIFLGPFDNKHSIYELNSSCPNVQVRTRPREPSSPCHCNLLSKSSGCSPTEQLKMNARLGISMVLAVIMVMLVKAAPFVDNRITREEDTANELIMVHSVSIIRYLLNYDYVDMATRLESSDSFVQKRSQ